jgi:hypothetical protein
MQTDSIPFPHISGLSDTQKLQAVITYLTQLVEELKRQLTSIDTTNMIPEVAEKIEKCITEETDLSEYATRSMVKEYMEKVLAKLNTMDIKLEALSDIQEKVGNIYSDVTDSTYGLSSIYYKADSAKRAADNAYNVVSNDTYGLYQTYNKVKDAESYASTAADHGSNIWDEVTDRYHGLEEIMSAIGSLS